MLVITPEQQVFLESLDDKTRRIFDQSPEKDKRSILAMIGQVAESKLEVLAEPWKVDYENEPVPIEKWLESDYYLGKTVAKDLRDFWKQEIAQVINKRCIEWIITGSIGGGKTYAAIQLLLYKIHEILCLRDPTSYYNAQSIVFGFFSILMNLVQSVEYQMFKNFVSESPYWCDIVNLDIQEGNSYKVQRAVFNFPKKVRFAFGSRAVHSLGQDLYAGLMDEVAFSNSLEAKQIVDLYANVRRRLDSRYLNTETGSLPGVLCLAGDTKIKLLDGTSPPIKDLCGAEALDVYAFDLEARRVVPAKACRAVKTGAGVPVVRVRFDTGEDIKVTSGHEFLLRSGDFVSADNLQPGDRIESLYTIKDVHGYEQIRGPYPTGAVPTHRLVARHSYGEWPTHGYVVHHKNFKKTDNRPENLVVMEAREHHVLHATVDEKTREVRRRTGLTVGKANLLAYTKTERHRRSSAERMRLLADKGKANLLAYNNLLRSGVVVRQAVSGNTVRVCRVCGLALRGVSFFRHERACERIAASGFTVDTFLAELPAHRSIRHLCDRFQCHRTFVLSMLDKYGAWGSLGSDLGRPVDRRTSRRGALNHTVVSVEPAGFEDVYDLINVSDHHNFAVELSQGSSIFVHNCVVSSANYDGDWLDTHIRKSKDKRGVHTSSAALYVAKGPFKGDTFRVLVGDKLHQSKIIDNDVDLDALACKPSADRVPEDARIEHVPVALYERYVEDLEGSLKDISGIALFSTSPLIPQRERIRACIDPDRVHPFTIPEPTVDIFDDEMTLESVFEPDKIFQQVDAYRKVYTPKINPGAPRFVGVDLALKHDGVGLAVCHTSGLKEVRRFDSEGNKFTEFAPIVYFDLLLRVKPPKGSEIDISKIRSFIFMLREMGMPISFVSADTYQSSDFLQICAKQGLEVKQISVDRPPCDPYLALKEAIVDGRVSYYQYDPFLNEVMTLQRDWEKKRVDHPPNGSKDCSDAAAQAYWSCSHSKYTTDRLNDASLLMNEKPEDQPSKPDDVRNFKQSGWAIGGDYEDADRITSYDVDGGGYF